MSTGGGGRPKPLVVLSGVMTTPPLPGPARRELGFLLRLLQNGESLGMPRSRPMPSVGPRCHELRVSAERQEWRLVYRTDPAAVVVAEVFRKTTRATPKHVVDECRRRLRAFDGA